MSGPPRHDRTSSGTSIERIARTAEDLVLIYFSGHSLLGGGRLRLALRDICGPSCRPAWATSCPARARWAPGR
ncbi:hypothetical protein [Actinokineospora sp. NBRC 105648]|uniref:hypothetical protein n=1 Tax=Actinokineospora sp. NBRC 105648 TaxID=3032206 RepID=UPI0024A0B7C0|nr:hypothetical protein [Actinokineospora sp. NBRC 105648]GLZ38599.1 hypothetical protein Acsp05_22230 [Actinokineospora sp. NBRC 105648]